MALKKCNGRWYLLGVSHIFWGMVLGLNCAHVNFVPFIKAGFCLVVDPPYLVYNKKVCIMLAGVGSSGATPYRLILVQIGNNNSKLQQW